MFELHPQLQQDCFGIGRFALCRLLLMNDSRYPWLILVPERCGITETFQLPEVDQWLLWQESSQLARGLAKEFAADKMNIAAIGNLVPQLHVHHVVRHHHDPAWPATVWGKPDPVPYDEAGLEAVVARLENFLPADFLWSVP
ncbi:MAG: HIT domain-containing protein [Candidatus Methylumidiphilus sp.]